MSKLIVPTTLANRKPLSAAFNVAVQQMASRLLPAGFDVGDNAPDTYADLRKHYQRTGRVLVDKGYSHKTSFADPEVNYAFRAWHDATHLRDKRRFTFDDEYKAAVAQHDDLCKVYGTETVFRADQRIADLSKPGRPFLVAFVDLLMAETYGQQCYARNHGGDFPDDQYAFTLAWLKTGPRAAEAHRRF